MSEMTKMLHYQTSSGSTGACKIYTTEKECPPPNLKVQIDDTTGYVKLSEEKNNPSATPIRVQVNSSGKTLNVLKEETASTAPTGEKIVAASETFTVPSEITVLEVEYNPKFGGTEYVGVTPGSTHEISVDVYIDSKYYVSVNCDTHNKYWGDFEWVDDQDFNDPIDSVLIRWSPEINKKSPTRTDYT